MSQYVLLRIQSLQEELESLKKIVSHQLLQSQRKTTYIRGLWKDFEINDDDFADARSSVFKDVAPQTRQNWWCFKVVGSDNSIKITKTSQLLFLTLEFYLLSNKSETLPIALYV